MNVTVQAEGISVAAKIEESEAYKQLKESAPEVVSILDKVNDGTMEMKDVTAELTKMAEGLTDETAKAALEEVITKLENKDFVTGFVDLTADATAEKNENGKYEVTIDVPSMTDEATGYDVLHYSVERSVWELIEPSETCLLYTSLLWTVLQKGKYFLREKVLSALQKRRFLLFGERIWDLYFRILIFWIPSVSEIIFICRWYWRGRIIVKWSKRSGL